MANSTCLSLIERVCNSPDDEVWKRFVKAYGPFIGGYLHRHGVRHADIDDIQQDVMEILLRELPNFEHNQRKGAFRAWLRNIIANRLRSFWRDPAHRQQAVGESVYMQLAQEFADPNSEASQALDREHNQHVIASLLETVATRFNEQTMEAFRQTFLNERPIDEVAQQLYLSVNAVVLARSRVLRALRECGEELID